MNEFGRELTNEQRATLARNAVHYYATASGRRGEPEKTLTLDLLADLMHHCMRMNYDWAEMLAAAEMHFRSRAGRGSG